MNLYCIQVFKNANNWKELQLSSYHIFYVCEDVSATLRELVRNGWEAENRNNNQHRWQGSLNSLFMESKVAQAQQWISARLGRIRVQKDPRSRPGWKHSRGIWSVANPCPHLLKGQNLVGFHTSYFMMDTTSRLTLLFEFIWPCMLAFSWGPISECSFSREKVAQMVNRLALCRVGGAQKMAQL